MTRFLRELGAFLLPIILLCASIEGAIQNIPNDYSYKSNYLNANSEAIEVLFLGSSHAYCDINPVFVNRNSFNAAYVSQTLKYDYEILDKYAAHWNNLKYIVLPVSYFSLFFDLETSTEAWRVKNYTLYYGMTQSNKISNYSELLSNQLEVNLERVNSYYFRGKSNITSSKLGWGNCDQSTANKDLIETGLSAAQRHTYPTQPNIKENMSFLKAIIAFAKEKGAKVIIYTPPAFHTYVENLDDGQLSLTIESMEQLDQEYENVRYFNFLNDVSFSETDFHDADHLNESGAKKLTQKINKLLQDSTK